MVTALRSWLPSPAFFAIFGQALFVVVGLAVLALAPARTGTFLLVPMTAGARAELAAIAVSRGAALVARGPLPGSLVIAGDRDRLFGPLFTAHIMLVAAPMAGCGTPEPR